MATAKVRRQLILTGLSVVAAAVAAMPARASERLSMPWRCDVVKGHLRLQPTGGTLIDYPVVTQRETMPFAVCSGFGSPSCPRLTLHRMLIQCGTARVRWVEVAEALLAASSVSVRVARGSLVIDAKPVAAAGAPCPSANRPVAPFHLGHRVGASEGCALEAAAAGREIVLPQGFAPLEDLGVRLAGRTDGVDLRAAQAVAAPNAIAAVETTQEPPPAAVSLAGRAATGEAARSSDAGAPTGLGRVGMGAHGPAAPRRDTVAGPAVRPLREDAKTVAGGKRTGDRASDRPAERPGAGEGAAAPVVAVAGITLAAADGARAEPLGPPAPPPRGARPPDATAQPSAPQPPAGAADTPTAGAPGNPLALRTVRADAVESSELPDIVTAQPAAPAPSDAAPLRQPFGAEAGRAAPVAAPVAAPAPVETQVAAALPPPEPGLVDGDLPRLLTILDARLASQALTSSLAHGSWALLLAALLAASAVLAWTTHAVRARRRLPAAAFASAELLPLAPLSRRPLLEAAPQIEALCQQTLTAIGELDAAPPLQEVLDGEVHQARQRLAAAVAAVETGDDGLRRASAMCRNIVRDLDRVRRIADSAVVSFRGTQDRIAPPATRAEAYAVLGVNPDVGEATLKKLADALRMSWHPDHARDEADRERREARTKQINIALDLVRGSRERGAA